MTSQGSCITISQSENSLQKRFSDSAE